MNEVPERSRRCSGGIVVPIEAEAAQSKDRLLAHTRASPCGDNVTTLACRLVPLSVIYR
jgi:hypothetical protein